LAAAERGELAVHETVLDAREILKSVCELYANHALARAKAVVVTEISGPYLIATDKLLLKRVLRNLVKNGLEASAKGQEVSLGFQNNGAPVFRVHNEVVMAEAVRLQVFRRSFSTKSALGRGIGTYSAKLITERYLGGSLSFTSSEEQGTTFAVTLPARNAT
jgi:signal transduction histidine kinase